MAKNTLGFSGCCSLLIFILVVIILPTYVISETLYVGEQGALGIVMVVGLLFLLAVFLAVCFSSTGKHSSKSSNDADKLYDSIINGAKPLPTVAVPTPAAVYVAPPDPDEVITELFLADDRAAYFHDEVEPLIEAGDITADDLRDYRATGSCYNLDGLRLFIDWDAPKVMRCDNTPSKWTDADAIECADYFMHLISHDKTMAAYRFFKKYLEGEDADSYDHKICFSEYLHSRIPTASGSDHDIYYYDFYELQILIQYGEVIDCGFDIDIPEPYDERDSDGCIFDDGDICYDIGD